MSEANDPAPAPRRNPLIWIAIVVIGLIGFVFMNGDRGDISEPQTSAPMAPQETAEDDETPVSENLADVAGESEVETETETETASSAEDELSAGTIQRSLLIPPGMRAREYISQLREAGKPYPLSEVYDKAETYRSEGSLADAHLLYFFAARESHLPAMMMMAEMADPAWFRAEDSLLDQADPVQAYKWYRKAADLGQAEADTRLQTLHDWALDAAAAGNSEARQLLLNYQ